MTDLREVTMFDTTESGPLVLSPQAIREAWTDADLEELIAWIGSEHEKHLKPRKCPFCGIRV